MTGSPEPCLTSPPTWTDLGQPTRRDAVIRTGARGPDPDPLVAGWFVKVDIDAFLGAHPTVHTPGARTGETWRRPRAHRQTYRRGTYAVTAAGLSLNQMRRFRLQDVTRDGSTVTVHGSEVEIEMPGRWTLTDHVLNQRSLGRDESDPLLTDDDGQPPSDH